MSHKIQEKLTTEELLILSRVVVLQPTEQFVQDVTDDIQVEHGKTELSYRDFNGVQMKHAYIVTSKALAA